jgi:hypothetical protein
MQKFFDLIVKAIFWCVTLIEDKKGSVSSKRFIALWAMWVLDRTYKSPEDYDQTLIWPLIMLVAAAAAITLPEWFSKLSNKD